MGISRWIKRLKRLVSPRALVLMYHRVADLPADPWQLAVRPALFEQQLQVLRERFSVIPLQELVMRVQQRTLRRHTVCLTFDDGYRDNFTLARPLLEKYQCPATFFVSTGYTVHQQLFWWDELQYLVLDAPQLPRHVRLDIAGMPLIYDLGGEAVLTEGNRQRQMAWMAPGDPPTRRCILYLRLWELLKSMCMERLQHTLTAIRTWAGPHPPADLINYPMSEAQLQDLSQYPLFDLGLHTVHHLSLSCHPEDAQCREIAGNRQALHALGHRPVNLLTFPYGDYNDVTIRAARKEQVAAAFTTAGRAVCNGADPYRLGRFQVMNWDRQVFETQLTRWSKNY